MTGPYSTSRNLQVRKGGLPPPQGAGGNESSLVFVDASEMQDAFMPVGSYTLANDKVTINLNLIRNDKPVAKVAVEGPITDESSKAALVQKLIAAIIAETQKTLY